MNKLVKLLAVIGLLWMIGSIGEDDRLMSVGILQPIECLYTDLAIGIMLTIPALVYDILGGKK